MINVLLSGFLLAKNKGETPPSFFDNAVIVCDGNSLTQGYGATNTSTKSYPARLAAMEPFASQSTVINKGVSGQTTQQMIDDAGTDIDPLFNGSVNSLLIAWEIGNDLYFNGNVTGAQNRFQAYCEARKSAGWFVVAMTVPYRDHSVVNGGVSPAGDNDIAYNSKRATINTWLRANFATFSDMLIDLDADSGLSSYNSTYFTTDRVHFNDDGYLLISTIVKDALLTLS